MELHERLNSIKPHTAQNDGVVGRDTKGPPLKGNGCEQRQLAARRPRPGEQLVSDYHVNKDQLTNCAVCHR